ncbi:MAG: peptide deformylase [Gammaproteobacteria bacterium]
MALLPILTFPDRRLRTVAKPIASVTDQHRQLIDDMLETMYAAPGVGLAATQVNVHERLLVVDTSENQQQPYALINPTWTSLSGEKPYNEGCLSVPGFYESVIRPDIIRVEALDRNGKRFSMECDGLLSVAIQHEIDHLEGKLFVDYLSKLKRERIRKKLEKQQRTA